MYPSIELAIEAGRQDEYSIILGSFTVYALVEGYDFFCEGDVPDPATYPEAVEVVRCSYTPEGWECQDLAER